MLEKNRNDDSLKINLIILVNRISFENLVVYILSFHNFIIVVKHVSHGHPKA